MTRPPAQDRLADRLLAEAVRSTERDGAALRNEPAADEAGRAAGGDLEHRIIRRASAVSVAGGLRDGLHQVQQSLAWIIAATLVIAVVTGAGAVRAALGSGPAVSTPVDAAGSVNFFLVLISLLGVQTLLLIAWLAIMILRPRAANVSPLGGAVMAAARWGAASWWAARGHSEPDRLAALRAVGVVLGRGAIGRWSLSAISHAVWTGANTGGLVILILLLSTREYTFNWETTILSSEAYERVTRVIGIVPHAAGFPVPTIGQIRATKAAGNGFDGAAGRDPAAARAWSGLLIGSLAVYGFGPRILLLGLSLSARRRARRRYRLDTSAPGYLKLRDRLMPAAESRGIIDGDQESAPPATVRVAMPAAASASATVGPPVLVGLEIDRPHGPWPPPLHAVRWNDLGFVDAREDRKNVLAELAALADPPVMTTIVCALTTTPDRGLGAFIESVTTTTPGPVGVVLTGGQSFRERADAEQVAQRVDDWRGLAERAGVAAAHVVEADLDHLTDASRQRLAHLVGGPPGAPGNDQRDANAPSRHIEEAFALIVTATRKWGGAPLPRDQAALQRDIAELYRHQTTGLIARLGLPAGPPDDVVASMKDGARRFVSVLPDRLQQSPKWLVAGALSGAVGCIAIGALAAPAALVALPAWTMGGAGLGALLQFARGGGDAAKSNADPARGDEPTLGDAVRAAALFALLLELQGRDEAEITRVLDRTLPADEEEGPAGAAINVMTDADAAAAWLDELRHRYDLALASAGEGRA